MNNIREFTCNYFLSPFSSYGGKLYFYSDGMVYKSPWLDKIGRGPINIKYSDIREIKRFKASYSLLNLILIPTGVFLVMNDGKINAFSTFKRGFLVDQIKEFMKH